MINEQEFAKEAIRQSIQAGLNSPNLDELCEGRCDDAFEEGRYKGRKEVVEWINERENKGYLSHFGMRHLWQDKLKEWGLEEG
jgi:hypothetical protein